LKIYVASKSKHYPWWQALRASGIDICASWIDAEFNKDGSEPSPDAWARHWAACVEEASSADVVLVFAQNGENHHGALIELGAALARGVTVFLVADFPWSIRHHPKVRCFRSLEGAVECLINMAAGERARAEVLNQLTPESWACVDCGVDTAPGLQARTQLERTLVAVMEGRIARPPQRVDDGAEIYCVTDNVWQEAGMAPRGGCLCVACIERRLGRSLQPADFEPGHPFNKLPGTARLLQRRGNGRCEAA
jgi:hypothetical protein